MSSPSIEPEGRSHEEGVPRAGEAFALVALGALFGVVLLGSEVASWYRIDAMFRFAEFHLFGVIGSAIVTSMLGLELARRFGPRAEDGRRLSIPHKERTPWLARYAFGGALFGVGWGLTGACPGPLFAWIGAGASIYLVPLAAALAGTFAYALVRDRLPH